MTPIDIVITLLSMVYIYFATRNRPVCFVFGLLASALWAYHDFVNLNLKFDGILQLFYVVMSVWGLYTWKQASKEKEALPITSLSGQENGIAIATSIILGVSIAWITGNILETALPYLDAVTTAGAVIATFLLVYRKQDTWIYWVVIDLLYIYIFYRQGAILLSLVMVVYAVLAVYGFIEWRRIKSTQVV
jgi:nicotinamide mononucleotide transporter